MTPFILVSVGHSITCNSFINFAAVAEVVVLVSWVRPVQHRQDLQQAQGFHNHLDGEGNLKDPEDCTGDCEQSAATMHYRSDVPHDARRT